ncbi:MAG: hypothetical protein ACXADY_19205 [Candidatus Hodarchaeales archaeon]|jgi:predicted nucleic acid-binding protein
MLRIKELYNGFILIAMNMMDEIAVLDTSLLINVKILEVLDYLCEIFSEIIITPEVWRESFQFQSDLRKIECLTLVELTKSEENDTRRLHDEFSASFPGKHRGEIEALVLSKSRGYSLLISDNFAPWYIKKNHKEFSGVRIYRGTYFFASLVDLTNISADFIDKLVGIYPQKDIQRMKRRFKGDE